LRPSDRLILSSQMRDVSEAAGVHFDLGLYHSGR
jgi:hypothetical protein